MRSPSLREVTKALAAVNEEISGLQSLRDHRKQPLMVNAGKRRQVLSDLKNRLVEAETSSISEYRNISEDISRLLSVVKRLDLAAKILKYPSWRTILAVKEDLEDNGLTIKETIDGRYLLCRIEEGRAVYDKILDDYVYIGSHDRLDESIDSMRLSMINDFVLDKASNKRLSNSSKSYNKNTSLYGKPVRVYNEGYSQEILSISKTIID